MRFAALPESAAGRLTTDGAGEAPIAAKKIFTRAIDGGGARAEAQPQAWPTVIAITDNGGDRDRQYPGFCGNAGSSDRAAIAE
ncbi:hypothetical protein [Bradyrhizobium sp. RDM4]|jgi:hypothetical protein|uniref:hypothetical protein n=1 Tax=Bradyrhizobium sp. RDM4 TaxID=3378765 RepID=UPI0038FC97C8